MKHSILKIHSEDCCRHEKNKEKDYWFSTSKTINILFYHNCEYYLITHCDCIRGYMNNQDWVIFLIENLLKKTKIVKYFDIEKSYHITKEIRDELTSGNLLGMYKHEINHIYCCNAGKEYGIVTCVKFINELNIDISLYKNKYLESKKYLEDNGFTFLLSGLEKLYKINMPIILDEIDIYLTLKDLQKGFNKQIKEKLKTKNYETSKH